VTAELTILITEDDADPERVDVLTGYLREELLQLDVDDVRRATGGPPPEGSRSFEVAAIGALLVAASEMATSLDQIIAVVRKWAGGGPRTVKITLGGDSLELSNASREQQNELVHAFIRRHSS
jgi:hypothetical protein